MDVHGRRVSLQVGIRCENDLPDGLFVHSGKKRLNLEIVRADPVHGGDSAVKDMIHAAIAVGALQCEYVESLFDDTYCGLVALRV